MIADDRDESLQKTLRHSNASTPELPGNDWDVDRLSAFARREHQAIVAGESTLAGAYWRLGNALTKVRKQMGHGHWLPYLASLGIEKTRSSKACAVYRTFPSLEDLSGMTVAEAYAARPRSSRTRNIEQPDPAGAPADEAVLKIAEHATQLETIVKAAAHGELLDLLGKVRGAIDRLRRLEQELKQTLDDLEDA